MRRLRRALIVAMALTSPPIAAQAIGRPSEEIPISPLPSILAGAGLGAAGFVVGGLSMGLLWSTQCGPEQFCGVTGALLGAAIGATLGLPLGVHLGNRRRGSYLLDVVTGVGVWVAGIGVIGLSDGNYTVRDITFVAMPIAQLVGTVLVERAWGHRRSASRTARLVLRTDVYGRIALGASAQF